MAEYGWNVKRTFVCGSNMPTSTWEHKFVGVQSAGTINAPTDKGTDAGGILEIGGNQGQAASVTVFGETKVRCGAALGAGARITTQASGYAVAVTSGEVPLGITLQVVTSGYLASAWIFGAGGTVNDA